MADNGTAGKCAAMQKNQLPAGQLIGRMQKNAAHPPDGFLAYPAVANGFFRGGFHLVSPGRPVPYHSLSFGSVGLGIMLNIPANFLFAIRHPHPQMLSIFTDRC
jgi:hypothetical protein